MLYTGRYFSKFCFRSFKLHVRIILLQCMQYSRQHIFYAITVSIPVNRIPQYMYPYVCMLKNTIKSNLLFFVRGSVIENVKDT